MKKTVTASQNQKTVASSKPSGVKERITEQDYEQLKATFDLFDQDGSGTIDPIEIQKIMEELGLTRRNPIVGEIINSLRDANRPINFNEFLDLVVGRVGETKTKDGISKVFGNYDRDGAGFIDLDKFKVIARELGETLNEDQLIELMHNTYILNNTSSNQAFNFEEFYSVVTKKRG